MGVALLMRQIFLNNCFIQYDPSILVAEASQTTDHKQTLERSMQEFDEKILRELEETQQQRQQNARQKAALKTDAELEGEDQGDKGQGEGQSDEQGEGQKASAEGNENEGESNETASSNGQENTEQTSDGTLRETETTPTRQTDTQNQEQDGSSNTQVADIPTGNDDDVIARQLREAAEAETDPEIKEKLWEEYRKYKNQ